MFEEIETLCEKIHEGMKVAAFTAMTLGPSQDVERLAAATAAIERVRRAADAAQLAVLAELARRGHARDPDTGEVRQTRGPAGEVAEMAVDEIAFVLGCSDHQAGVRAVLAVRLADHLDPLIQPLLDGGVPEQTLRLVADETAGASPEAVAAVVEHVLAPKRGTKTPRIEALDRHDLAQACRRVLDRIDPGWREEKARVNRTERTDVRTYPGDLGTTELVATLPSEAALVLKSAIDEHAAALQRDEPNLLAGPARAQALTDLALRGVTVSTHITLGLALVHGTSSSPLGPVPTNGDEREGPPRGPVAPTNGDEHQTPWLSGIEIPRIGWIPGSVVQTLTQRLDTRITRALLDPDEGTVLETSVTGYVPPPSMKRLVRLRDTRCRMYGCDRPAIACDLDHANPYPHGPTSAENLGPLCRHHHRVKHSPGWTYTLHPDGHAEWTSPGGTRRVTWPTAHAPVESGTVESGAVAAVKVQTNPLEAGAPLERVDAALGSPPF